MEHRHEVTVNFNVTGLEKIVELLFNNKKQLDKIMATLQDLQEKVAAENTVIDSAITLLNGLAAAVAALKPNQEAIDALAADITAKTSALSDAVTANTPAEGAEG